MTRRRYVWRVTGAGIVRHYQTRRAAVNWACKLSTLHPDLYVFVDRSKPVTFDSDCDCDLYRNGARS